MGTSETSEILVEDLQDIPYETISAAQYGNGEFGFTAGYEEDSVLLTICRGEKSSGGYDLSVKSILQYRGKQLCCRQIYYFQKTDLSGLFFELHSKEKNIQE